MAGFEWPKWDEVFVPDGSLLESFLRGTLVYVALLVLFRIILRRQRGGSVGLGDLMLLILNLPFDVPGSPRRRGLRARDWLDTRIRRILADVRARGETKGLLPALLSARDEDGEPLSEQDLVAIQHQTKRGVAGAAQSGERQIEHLFVVEFELSHGAPPQKPGHGRAEHESCQHDAGATKGLIRSPTRTANRW